MKLAKQITLLIFLVISLSVGSLIVAPNTAYAAVDPKCDKSRSFLEFPTWYKYLDVKHDGKSCNVELPTYKATNSKGEIVENTDWRAAIGSILLAVFEIILRIGLIVAIGFVIFGGIQYILSQGEPERTKESRSTIINALIGLVIAIFATAIVNLVAGAIK